MKALQIILLLVAAILAGVAAGFVARPAVEKSGALNLLTRGTAPDARETGLENRVAVTALGRLEPETEIIQVGVPAGSRVERLGEKVKEGAFVTRGEPLAYLDSYAELV